jgi:hypothetical protein
LGRNVTFFEVNDDDDDIIIIIIITPANANYVNIITTSYRRAQCWQNERFTYKAPSTALYAGKQG